MDLRAARLWLGITGVGSLVVVSIILILTQSAGTIFPTTDFSLRADYFALAGFLASFVIFMIPFDLLGGFILPRRFGRDSRSFNNVAKRWARGTALQSTLFLLTAVAVLTVGSWTGRLGAFGLVGLLAVLLLLLQGTFAQVLTQGKASDQDERVEPALQQINSWGLKPLPIVVLDNSDGGFTGGLIGLPGSTSIVIPKFWVDRLSPSELAVALARRVEASSSRLQLRGLVVALIWTLSGFLLSTYLPGAGVRSVAQLVTTCCGFTCWTFIGLLVLPTVSRKASYTIDRAVLRRGVPPELLDKTLAALDRFQDDEPQRAGVIETIFHPVPSIENRRMGSGSSGSGAWHAARMMLFLSWSCLGFLSRAVHCNAGRPELWVMLPTD